MISQPMFNKTDEEISEVIGRFLKYANKENLTVVNTFFQSDWFSNIAMKERGVVHIPVCYLAKSIESMSQCHKVYFAKGWENARGCVIEHEIALHYGLEIIYEED